MVRKEKNNNLKVIVFAYHNMGIEGLEALSRHGFDIASVFTHEDDAGENCWFGSVKEWALLRNIPVYTTEEINTPYWTGKICELKPDIIFSFYYRKMIDTAILAIPEYGSFNLHGSLLPLYRGRCPVNWVLINGEKKTGVTLHYMIDKPDAGDIVGQREIPICLTDTAIILYDKLCNAAAALLDDLLPLIKRGSIPRNKQNLETGSYFGGRKPADGRIDWNKSADNIYDLIRGVTKPYPGAFAFAGNDENITIWWAESVESESSELPGTVNITPEEVLVQTGKNAIKLKEIEVTGKCLIGKDIVKYFRDGKVTSLK